VQTGSERGQSENTLPRINCFYRPGGRGGENRGKGGLSWPSGGGGGYGEIKKERGEGEGNRGGVGQYLDSEEVLLICTILSRRKNN
jgi:hypothetical protein